MASEKGDLPHDTDSLPPHYASSETFTDSAPPVYRKTNTVRLQITRVVCFTVLTAGFLTGMFILAHTYITNRDACDCSAQAPNLPPSSQALLQASVIPSIMDEAPRMEDITNDIDASDLDMESRLMDIPLPLDEEEIENSLELAKEAMEEETEGLQSLVDENANRIRLPIDMLLGNPALAGKDVQCKVEKKLQNLGGGVLSKTIMVTCDDDNDDDDADSDSKVVFSPFEAILGSRPSPQPPMSLLAPILKMMAARANARLQRQMQPKIIMRRFPLPVMQPMGMAMNGPFRHPMNTPYPAGPFDGPMPFPPSMNSQMPRMMNYPRPPPRSFQGPMQVSGNDYEEDDMAPMPFPFSQVPQEHLPRGEPRFPFNGNHNFERENFEEMNHEEPQNMLFREDFDEEEPRRPFAEEPQPIFRPFPPQEQEMPEILEQNRPGPIKVIHGFPPQIPDAIRQIVSHIMKSTNKRDGSENMPIIAIKAIHESRSADSIQGPPRSKLLLPFPFRAMKMHSSRGGRKLEDESFHGAPFPLPRGAIQVGMKPIVMPEAAGRALDSPMTLPAMQEISPLRFFPGRLLRLPVPLQGQAITHMEIKQNPNLLPINEEDEQINNEEQEQIEPLQNREEPFGPPRRHTVIRGPPLMEDNISQNSDPLSPFLTRFPLPPPPKFAREGRTGIVREVDPDAELVIPAETRAHHIISVN